MSAAGEGRYFDSVVEADGDFNPFTERGWRTLARRFAEVVPGPVRRLLDVGCGTGRSQAVYRDRAAAYVGIDLSLRSLRGARRHVANAAFAQADALRLPFAAASFDAVAFSSVLHHVGDRRSALVEAARIVRPGGWIFAFDPNLLHPAMLLLRDPRSPLYDPRGVSPGERPLRAATLQADFRAAGLTDVGQRAQSDLPYRRVAPAGLNLLLPLYNRADWLWERVGFGRWFGAFVVTWARRP